MLISGNRRYETITANQHFQSSTLLVCRSRGRGGRSAQLPVNGFAGFVEIPSLIIRNGKSVLPEVEQRSSVSSGKRKGRYSQPVSVGAD
jgi:hypothetical protein